MIATQCRVRHVHTARPCRNPAYSAAELCARHRPLLVGESNPYGGDPEAALYPSPRGSAGWRMCHVVMGLRADEYLDRFGRVNLVGHGRWDRAAARSAAARILSYSRRPLVLLGAKVADAFGVEYLPFTVQRLGATWVAVLPHPSGLCRTWNDPASAALARGAVEELERAVGS